MPQAEITIQYLGENKKNPRFGYIKSSEGDTYGCQSTQLKQFSTGQIYTIKYHVNDKGYNEFDSIVTSPPLKQNVRPVTAPRESRQIAILSIAKGFKPVDHANIDEMEATMTRILLASAKSYDRVLGGAQTQARDDMNDEIPFA